MQRLAGTDLAEFCQLSEAALAGPMVQVGALSLAQATELIDLPGEDDFPACGFGPHWRMGPVGSTTMTLSYDVAIIGGGIGTLGCLAAPRRPHGRF